MPIPQPSSQRFFGSLPATGPWTPLRLSRRQFLGILAISVGLFIGLDGPLWQHLRDHHATRLTVSYMVIPPLVALALWRNDRLAVGRLLAGVAVIGLAKLVVTAGLLVVLTLAR